MTLYKLLIIAITLLFLGCSDSDDNTMDFNNTQYQVTFDINWNERDFPTDYPANAHFSKLIGWSHKSSNTFMDVGTLASTGIKDMAERGTTSPLDAEISEMINNKEGHILYIGDGLSSGVGKIELIVEVNTDYPSISFVSMVAPSPDWYIGIVNVNLFDGDKFITDTTIVGKVYDAGTDDGTTFTSTNIISNPQKPIYIITQPPLGDGTEINEKFCTVKIVKL